MGLILLQERKYAAALVAAKQYLGAYRISLYPYKRFVQSWLLIYLEQIVLSLFQHIY